MSPATATAKVFVTAWKSLPKEARGEVIHEMLNIKELREDLIDIAIAQSRKRGPFRPFREFLAETSAK
jgi:hypothetical protein